MTSPSEVRPGTPKPSAWAALWGRRTTLIAAVALLGIAVHLVLRLALHAPERDANLPLLVTLVLGGLPLVFELLGKMAHRQFGADLLGGVAIVTSVLLHEYLAGAIIVLMLAGGQALESFALRSASSVLSALASRMPSVAHRRRDGVTEDVQITDIAVDDTLMVHPHEACPADGMVIEGDGTMDESYLTGEPFQIRKTIGSSVLSGAVNGTSVLAIRTTKVAADSRYAKIMLVMKDSESSRPHLQRLGDQLGALYTPLALAVAGLAWAVTHDPIRFLAVMVIATPCPLLLAIPIAVMGSISLCARRAIIVKTPAVLEQISGCRTAIFDKTGTLTYGEPQLTECLAGKDFDTNNVLGLVADLERYSKHPLATAIVKAAEERKLEVLQPTGVGEEPGQGLRGVVQGKNIQVTSRARLVSQATAGIEALPPIGPGLECVVAIDDHYAALLRFRDSPRAESRAFVGHLGPKHRFARVMLVSGDRQAEVTDLAGQVGITEIHAEQSPEQKLALVRAETALAPTLYVGDGINDAPAMMAATVGIAIGKNSDVTAAAAGVVILDNALDKVDEFIHISRRMRGIAMQSAVGGMALSMIGMGFAATGHLSPVQGAVTQEVIDVMAVLNALRAAFPPRTIRDIP
jgi:heavy metal translocating P-type ATPase